MSSEKRYRVKATRLPDGAVRIESRSPEWHATFRLEELRAIDGTALGTFLHLADNVRVSVAEDVRDVEAALDELREAEATVAPLRDHLPTAPAPFPGRLAVMPAKDGAGFALVATETGNPAHGGIVAVFPREMDAYYIACLVNDAKRWG